MDESAVAESVGVILIVAVTVILAAVIAAYAFVLVDTVHVERNLVLTAEQTSPTVILITYRGGGSDQTLLTSITITWPNGVIVDIPNPKVGDIYQSPAAGVTINADHVIVVGHFRDGKDQVLLNAFV
jgi:archaeal type IV pilus assembly protein PilA